MNPVRGTRKSKMSKIVLLQNKLSRCHNKNGDFLPLTG